MALRKHETPPPTGVYTTCKLCGVTKDDAEFKWSKGKRAGLVCRECDRIKKTKQYAEDEAHREHVKAKSRKYELDNPDKVMERSRKYREGNEELKAKKRAYQQAEWFHQISLARLILQKQNPQHHPRGRYEVSTVYQVHQ